MEGTTFVLIIVVMGMVTGIIMEWLKRGRNQSSGLNINKLVSELGLDDVDGFKKYREKIANLEERVQVLEKLATDKKHNLADEIDRL